MADVNAPTNDGLVLTVQLPEAYAEVEIRHFGFAVDFQLALAHQGAEKASADVESAIQDVRGSSSSTNSRLLLSARPHGTLLYFRRLLRTGISSASLAWTGNIVSFTTES